MTSETAADWMMPPESLVAPRAVVVWEYAREAEMITATAAELQRLILLARPEAMPPSGVSHLVRHAREAGYRYPDFLYPKRESSAHEWAGRVYSCVRRLDAIMPNTDWRFVLEHDFPDAAWWNRRSTGRVPRPCGKVANRRQLAVASGASLSDLVDHNDRGFPTRADVYLVEFRVGNERIVATSNFLPREEDSSYGIREIPVVIVAIALRDWKPERFSDAVQVLTATANQLCLAPRTVVENVKGFAVAGITEDLVDGVNEWELSLDSIAAFDTWRRAARVRHNGVFRGIVVPVDSVRNKPAGFWRRFFAEFFRQAARKGWGRDEIPGLRMAEATDVWTWSTAQCNLALKRLAALRASRHLTFAQLNSAIGLAASQREKALVTRQGRFGGDFARAAESSTAATDPLFTKKSHLADAAKAASEEFHRVFPALAEEPRTAFRLAKREAEVKSPSSW